MLKTTVLFICLLTSASVGHSQSSAPTFANGRTWNVMTLDDKRFYLIGFRDALGFSGTIKQYWGNYSGDDYRRELDKVYDEAENLEIPIWLTFRYVSLKLEGTHTREFLENFLMGLRQAKNGTPPPAK